MSQSVAQNVLASTAKRLSTLEKSLTKKKRALQVQEELERPPTEVDLESNKTFIYYSKELTRVEEEFTRKRELLDAQEQRDKEALEIRKREMLQRLDEERATRRTRYEKEVSKAYNEAESKTKYYQDAIESLKEKLLFPQPTGKVYRRLKAEVDMEQKEYDALKAQLECETKTYNEIVIPKELEALKKKALADAAAQKRKEELELQEKREAAIAARKQREAADEARQLAALEGAQNPPNVLESLSRAPEKKEETPPKNIPRVVEGGSSKLSSKPSSILERIKAAPNREALEAIALKETLNDEEETLWNERHDFFSAQEDEERAAPETNSIVSETPAFREEVIAGALRAAIANDMAEQDRIINDMSPLEVKEYTKRIAAHYAAKPKAPPFAFPAPISGVEAPGYPPPLKTTKKFVVMNSVAKPALSR